MSADHPSDQPVPRRARATRRSRRDRHSARCRPHRRTRRRSARLRGRRDRQQPALRRRRLAGADPDLGRAPGRRRRRVAERIGVPTLRRATPEFVREHTGQVIGGVSPIGHPAPVPTYLDSWLQRYDVVWAAAGPPGRRVLDDVRRAARPDRRHADRGRVTVSRIIVVGGGLGGLASAARLAKLGHQVVLVEASPTLGGALGAVSAGRLHLGRSARHRRCCPAALRDLFRKSGRPLEAELGGDLEPLERDHRAPVRGPHLGAGARRLAGRPDRGVRRARTRAGRGMGRHVDTYAPVWDVLRRTLRRGAVGPRDCRRT